MTIPQTPGPDGGADPSGPGQSVSRATIRCKACGAMGPRYCECGHAWSEHAGDTVRAKCSLYRCDCPEFRERQ